MLHMCAADLLYALIIILPTMAITFTVPVFYGSNILCKLVKFLQMRFGFLNLRAKFEFVLTDLIAKLYLKVIPMYASSFLLVAISADRHKVCEGPIESFFKHFYFSTTICYEGRVTE